MDEVLNGRVEYVESNVQGRKNDEIIIDVAYDQILKE